MAIGSISSTGKQNVANTGGLKYKRIQKGTDSYCFIADDSVVDFDSLVNFIALNGGSSSDTPEYKRTIIPATRNYTNGSYVAIFTALVITQVKTSGSSQWSTPSTITATAYNNSAGDPYAYRTIDNTWTVV